MRAAYEAALAELDVSEQNSPITELIAKAILNVTLRGERDPKEIKERALNALGLRFSFDGHTTPFIAGEREPETGNAHSINAAGPGPPNQPANPAA